MVTLDVSVFRWEEESEREREKEKGIGGEFVNCKSSLMEGKQGLYLFYLQTISYLSENPFHTRK